MSHPFIHVLAERSPMPGPTLGTGESEHPEPISPVVSVHVIVRVSGPLVLRHRRFPEQLQGLQCCDRVIAHPFFLPS